MDVLFFLAGVVVFAALCVWAYHRMSLRAAKERLEAMPPAHVDKSPSPGIGFEHEARRQDALRPPVGGLH